MKLCIENDTLYLDNFFFCFVSPADGSLKPGIYPIEVRHSHTHGEDLVHADGLGWIGAQRGVVAVLGRMRKANNVVDPCGLMSARLINAIDTCADVGERVTLEVVG